MQYVVAYRNRSNELQTILVDAENERDINPILKLISQNGMILSSINKIDFHWSISDFIAALE